MDLEFAVLLFAPTAEDSLIYGRGTESHSEIPVA